MIILKLNESSASLRVVPIPPLLQNSATTSYCTNESGRTFEFSIGGVYYASGGSISAVSSVVGDYTCNFAASKISVAGIGAVYYGGPGSSTTALRVSAPIMVVPFDSFDSMRLGLFALPNAAAAAADGLVTFGTGTGQLHVSSGSVGLKAGTHSEVTIQGVTRVNSGVTLNANTHSGATIKGIENYANISNVTLHAGTHSSVTIQGLSNYANISNVTLHAGTHSNVTIQGLSNYANFPMTSVASSVWSTLRSNFTTPGSFGEYVYSQVTGTSTGTVQGVTRALNLSTNDDKTGYEIAGTKTTLDDLNDIDGSGVTLHAGTHSGATVQGLSNYANISNVTLHAGTHSGATVQGVSNYANISNVTLHAGTHSNVTIQGVTRLNSSVTLNANTHSGATIAGIVAGGLLNATIADGFLTSGKFGAGAIDAAALATDAGEEIADRLLLRNIASGSDGGRDVRSALYPLRNRSLIQGSVGTVFEVDDSTSAWTFAPSLGTAPLSGIDPQGP